MTEKEKISASVNKEILEQGKTTYSINKNQGIHKANIDMVRGKGKLKEKDYRISTLIQVLNAIGLKILITKK